MSNTPSRLTVEDADDSGFEDEDEDDDDETRGAEEPSAASLRPWSFSLSVQYRSTLDWYCVFRVSAVNEIWSANDTVVCVIENHESNGARNGDTKTNQ